LKIGVGKRTIYYWTKEQKHVREDSRNLLERIPVDPDWEIHGKS